MRGVLSFRTWPVLTRTALAFALLGGIALPNRHASLFSNHPDPAAARAEHLAAWTRTLGLRPSVGEIVRAVAAAGGHCRLQDRGRWACSVDRPGRVVHPFARTVWTCTILVGDRPWAAASECRRSTRATSY